MIYRLILCASDDLQRESATFTDVQDTTPANDFCRPNEKVVFDKKISADLPTFFPIGETLKR